MGREGDFRNEIMDRLRSIGNNLSQTLTPFCEKWGITPVLLRILDEVSQIGPVSVSGLSNGVGVVLTNVSSCCKKLERLGYVSRTRDSQDERVVLIALTERGKKLIDDIHADIEDTFQEFFESLDEGGKEELLVQLARLDGLTTKLRTEAGR
ncbi:MAG: MarR family transcriptional regulator [Sphaerochaetaceae bacterium]|nr:MarR family transcriptional regulator [Sphaerochaetaceae bacterium]